MMIKSKAIDLLQSLNAKEFKEFGEFVRSPFFNKNPRQVQLYEIFKKYHPDFNSPKLTKEHVFERLYTGKKYKDNEVRRNLSEILKLGEEYLVYLNINKSREFAKKRSLVSELDFRKLDKLFNIKITELDEIYKTVKDIEDNYFSNNFDLEVLRLNYNIGRGRGGFEPEVILNNLQRCAAYLICYSLITIFKLNQDIIVRSMGFDFDYKNTIAYKFIVSLGPEKFIDSMKIYAPEFYPVLAIYFNRFMIAAGFDEADSYYNKLKEFVLKHLGSFTRFEKYNLMLFLENSCDEKILLGKDFKIELHNVHKKMLASGLFTFEDKDYFPLIGFRKVIRNALSINEFSWTEGFISKYLNTLPKEFRNNMHHYSQALLSFHKGKFDKALENISKVKFEIYSIKFDVWALKLQTEFELEYYEEALYSLDSYRHLMKNDTASPAWMKARFLNFLNYYTRILRIRNEENKFSEIEAKTLKDEISKCRELVEKLWLLEKLNE